MDWLFNSPFTNQLLKLAFSKSGVVVRWIVGYIIGGVAALKIMPNGDLDTIQLGLTQGLTAGVALAYAGINYWLNKRRNQGSQVVQMMLNEAGGHVNTNGVIGNGTIAATQKVTGVNAAGAINTVRS